MRNAGLEEVQAAIRLLGEISITSDDTTLRQKVKRKLKKLALKLIIQKTKIMASDPITSWQIEGEKWNQ